jgi:hypothetical protein
MTTAALGFSTRDLIPSSRQTCSSRSSPTYLNPVFRSYLWELTRCCRPLTDRGCPFPSISSKRPSRYHPLHAIRVMTSPNLRLPPKPVGPTGKSSLLLPCLHQWRSLPGVWSCFFVYCNVDASFEADAPRHWLCACHFVVFCVPALSLHLNQIFCCTEICEMCHVRFMFIVFTTKKVSCSTSNGVNSCHAPFRAGAILD